MVKKSVIILLIFSLLSINTVASSNDCGNNNPYIITNGEIVFSYVFNEDDYKKIDNLLKVNSNLSLGDVMEEVCPEMIEKSKKKQMYYETLYNNYNKQYNTKVDWNEGCYSNINISGKEIFYYSETRAKYETDVLFIMSQLWKQGSDNPFHSCVAEVLNTDYIAMGDTYDLPPTGNYYTNGIHRFYHEGFYSGNYYSSSNIVSYVNPYE